MSYTFTYNTASTPYTINNTSITNGINYTYPSSTWSDTIAVSANTSGNVLTVKGDAEFSGDIKIKGKSISESLERIEERLAILRPNEELEEKWEQLRGLRKAYMELEAEIKEKEQIWKILKK